MGIGPEDLERAVFKERFRGYDQDEVDRFLDEVAAGIAALRDERDALAAEVESLRGGGGMAPAAGLADADHLLKRTIGAAQRTAEELVADARRQAGELVEEARRAAAREREQSRGEAELLRRAVSDLRAFRDEYRARLHAVVSEQLAALDRAGELPRLPQSVEQVLAPVEALQGAPEPTPARSWAEAAASEPEDEPLPSEPEAAPWDDVWGGDAWGPREGRPSEPGDVAAWSPGEPAGVDAAPAASAVPGWPEADGED